MNHITRIMIDMETTATDRDAGILTLGAKVFGLPFGANAPQFYERASCLSNEQVGRRVDKATMMWWEKQSEEMRAEAFGGTQAIDDLLDHFRNWCAEHVGLSELGNIELWSRGAGFDCEIFQHAYLQIFGKYPFDFRKHMCQRTVERLMPESLKNAVAPRLIAHHALHDAINQANLMDVALRNISWYGNNFGMQGGY